MTDQPNDNLAWWNGLSAFEKMRFAYGILIEDKGDSEVIEPVEAISRQLKDEIVDKARQADYPELVDMCRQVLSLYVRVWSEVRAISRSVQDERPNIEDKDAFFWAKVLYTTSLFFGDDCVNALTVYFLTCSRLVYELFDILFERNHFLRWLLDSDKNRGFKFVMWIMRPNWLICSQEPDLWNRVSPKTKDVIMAEMEGLYEGYVSLRKKAQAQEEEKIFEFIKQFPSYRIGGILKKSITNNRIDYFRQKGRWRDRTAHFPQTGQGDDGLSSEELADVLMLNAAIETLESYTIDFAEGLEFDEAVAGMVQRLTTERQSDVFRLCFIECKSPSEIAAFLSNKYNRPTTEAAVRQIIRQIRKKLRS